MSKDANLCPPLEPRPQSAIVCEDVLEGCTDSYFCANSDSEPVVVRRCDLFKTCSRYGVQISRQPVCPGGKYDAINNQCVFDSQGELWRHSWCHDRSFNFCLVYYRLFCVLHAVIISHLHFLPNY